MQRRLWTQQLLALLALQACTSSGQRVAGLLSANYVPKSQPFTLGIASGSPTPESVILWTRIAPVELNLADTALQSIRLRWEVASDENFKQIKRSGELLSSSERAHCVHLKVQGLTPNTPYFYRFHCADFTSAVGRTRSAPRPQDLVQKLRIAYASCQHWEFGYFGAYQDLVASQPDLVIFLGDYIYEAGAYAGAGQRARRHPAGAARTLDQYRARYALYKSDESLQLAHACAPWLNIWDDHEVENDYAALTPRDRAPDFAERRIAAYRAFFEHMPVDFEALTTQARGLNSRIYTRLDWGPLARIHLLDTRQYRDVHACVPPGRGGAFAPARIAQ